MASVTHDFPAGLAGGGARDLDASATRQFSARVATLVGEGARSIAGRAAVVAGASEPRTIVAAFSPVILTTAASVLASEL